MCCCSGAGKAAACAPGCSGPQLQYQTLRQRHSCPLAQSAAAPGGSPADAASLCLWEKCPSAAARHSPGFWGLHVGEEHIGRYIKVSLTVIYTAELICRCTSCLVGASFDLIWLLCVNVISFCSGADEHLCNVWCVSVVLFLMTCLKAEVAQAETSLLVAAASCPLYGRAHCITAALQQLSTG